MKSFVTTFVFVLLFLLYINLDYFLNDNDQLSECKRLETIASDPIKINYFTTWVRKKIQDKKFLEHLGWLGRTSRIDDSEYFDKLDLDIGFIGVNATYPSIELNRNFVDRDDYSDFRNIKSVSLGEGRHRIIVKLNESNGLGDLIRMEMLTKINDNVFVYCDGSTKFESMGSE